MADKVKPSVLHNIRSILCPCNHEAVPPAIPKVKAPMVRGHGLRETIWKGCRGAADRAQVVILL